MTFIFWIGALLAVICLINLAASKMSAWHELVWLVGVLAGCVIAAYSKGIFHI